MKYYELDPDEVPKPIRRHGLESPAVPDLKKSLQESGFLFPVLLSPGRDGNLLLVDGAHRVNIARKLGLKVPVAEPDEAHSAIALLAATHAEQGLRPSIPRAWDIYTALRYLISQRRAQVHKGQLLPGTSGMQSRDRLRFALDRSDLNRIITTFNHVDANPSEKNTLLEQDLIAGQITPDEALSRLERLRPSRVLIGEPRNSVKPIASASGSREQLVHLEEAVRLFRAIVIGLNKLGPLIIDKEAAGSLYRQLYTERSKLSKHLTKLRGYSRMEIHD